MAELACPLRAMKSAIQTARIAYPNYERESGTKWPDEHLDPAEAQLFAFAALRALDGAGFEIVPKKEAAMIVRDPKIVKSELSRTVRKDGVTVEVSIIRLEDETEWSLEVVNAANTSTVWDDLFASDEEAFAEFERTVAEKGMEAFFDSGKVISFPR